MPPTVLSLAGAVISDRSRCVCGETQNTLWTMEGEWEMYPVRTMGWLRKVCSSVVNMLEKENNGDREQWEPRVATVLST